MCSGAEAGSRGLVPDAETGEWSCFGSSGRAFALRGRPPHSSFAASCVETKRPREPTGTPALHPRGTCG
ncbi:hypothetical protein NDU88_002053 [Pleurodeles waltl]|uniref:Uncharacterized protein n=1 Tax=Pleurodeles waltl TaxID=8319 RepID=A0AAV7TKX0_PLEWA|nr:hypothetical protein NDU88_002053 [Pleurodeles waltl]